MGGSPHSAGGLDNASAAAATGADRPVGLVAEQCAAVGWVHGYYDDKWQTPLTLLPMRVTDVHGAVIDDGGRTIGLATHGLEDGQTIQPVRHELGTQTYHAPQEGRVLVEIGPDPGGPDPAALEAQIIADLQAFATEMETAINPWQQRWEDEGWWGLVGSFFEKTGDGLSAWWEGEGEFWDTVWSWLKNLPDLAADAFEGASVGLKQLWDRRNEILSLIEYLGKGLIEEFEDGIELLLELLENIPGLEEIVDLLKAIVQESAEWAAAMIELSRTKVLTVLTGTIIGALMMIPPNFWTDMVGLASGYLIPEVFIAIIFALIAFFSGGTLGAGLAVRLTTFVGKVSGKLASAGQAGVVLIRMLEFLLSLMTKMIDLIKALKRRISEVNSGATGEATPVIRRTGPRVPPNRLPHHRADIPDEYYDPDTGDLLWPNEKTTGIRDGFASPPVYDSLPEGTIIDRYSPDSGLADTGNFLSPAGASYDSRALPYIENPANLTTYRVARPLPVQSGHAAPWFGAPGGATQFKTGSNVGQLVKDGFLEVIPNP